MFDFFTKQNYKMTLWVSEFGFKDGKWVFMLKQQ